MKYLIFTFSILFTLNLQSQNEGCDGSRYVDFIFDEIKITEGIKFGEGNEINGTFQELEMDIYEPANDVIEKRPLIVLAFGGSFIAGERQDLDLLCEAYARKGYVAVTIDYRLYDGLLFPLPTGLQIQEVVVKAVGDMKAAIRYMRKDADTDNLYGIDPNMVIVGGVSAGAIVAMHTATLDSTDEFDEVVQAIIDNEQGLEGTTNDLFEYSSDVQGAINFSGGLASSLWIDANDPPFISVHDEFDDTVPYESGFASVLGIDIIFMQGSKTCSAVADSLGVLNTLYTIEGSEGHVSYFAEMNSTIENINRSTDFISELVCSESVSTNENDITDLFSYPNPTSGVIYFGEPQLNVSLYDLQGRSLISKQSATQLDLRALTNGIYFLHATNKTTGDLSSSKVILEK